MTFTKAGDKCDDKVFRVASQGTKNTSISPQKRHRMSLSKPLRKPRFKDWLIYILDNDLCSEDAKWKDRSRRTAIIRWPHKSRGTWTLEKDAKLFKMWAITSGKYRANIDDPNPKSWKCNFRMNLNICKNIIELKQERIPKGPNACRVFKFLDRRTALRSCPFPEFDGE